MTSPWDEISATDTDAEGNPIEPGDDRTSVAENWATETPLDPIEEAEAYGLDGPPVAEDPTLMDGWPLAAETDDHGEDVPDEACACHLADEWIAREYTDEPDDEPPATPEPERESGPRIIRTPNGGVRIEDGGHTYLPLAKKFKDETGKLPSDLTDAELLAAMKGVSNG